ncbi:hypothetical protein BDW02DRAFT_382601 [Decorospora gaudefroyi]|uniref:Uncharacterized protein n=1 Tax=Decorospora gaudefroyi TaxID=184978 RepID=A0A6A5KC89_9PLEO|nr:hypothetical protein BDW02DRAFT_382601 [Decorospora gaudefroyi]
METLASVIASRHHSTTSTLASLKKSKVWPLADRMHVMHSLYNNRDERAADLTTTMPTEHGNTCRDSMTSADVSRPGGLPRLLLPDKGTLAQQGDPGRASPDACPGATCPSLPRTSSYCYYRLDTKCLQIARLSPPCSSTYQIASCGKLEALPAAIRTAYRRLFGATGAKSWV